MKNLLVVLMLVIMGQRWEIHERGMALPECRTSPDGWMQICKEVEPKHRYRLVYVIGEEVGNIGCAMPVDMRCATERFTIPVPNVPTKAMTKDEAERANKTLDRQVE